MWTPDIRTIFFLIFLINAFLTLMIVAFWKTQKTYDGFAIWAISLLFQSLAYLLFMLRGNISDLLSIPVANMVSMFAIIMRIDAIRRFFWGKAIPYYYYSLLVPIFLSYLYFTYILDSMLFRAAISTLFLSPALIIAGSLAILSQERETRIIRYLFAASLAIPSLILIVRLISWVILPGEYTIFSTDLYNTGFFVIAIIADILATGFFLMLNMVRSQTELQGSERKYRSLFESMLEGSAYCRMVYDDTGKPVDWIYLDVNASFSEITGLTNIIGRHVNEAIPATRTTTPELYEIYGRVARGGGPERFEIEFRPLNKWFSVSVFSPKQEHFVAVFQDITQRKQAESALRLTNEKLNLLSGITRHDIRNQLHALTGFLELSRQAVRDPDRASELIAKEEKIAATIAHQISFTKDYEDVGVLAPAWQNVDGIIREAKATLPMRGVRIEMDRPDLEIYADPLLGRVFFNLIDNALRYGGEGMTSIRVIVQETEKGLQLAVEDNGCGIAPEDRQRLFSRGYGKNTGLGLFLSREILAITGIIITETSGTGCGARFEILVPKREYRFIKS